MAPTDSTADTMNENTTETLSGLIQSRCVRFVLTVAEVWPADHGEGQPLRSVPIHESEAPR